jgi:hypothetical protein
MDAAARSSCAQVRTTCTGRVFLDHQVTAWTLIEGPLMTNGDIRRRNPFGVPDAPDPDGGDIDEFAATADLDGSSSDANASRWSPLKNDRPGELSGGWSSRWNGAADPTVPGDSAEAWKEGHAEVRTDQDRVYILFDWASGKRRALLDVRRQGEARLIGRYVNLSDPTIIRP